MYDTSKLSGIFTITTHLFKAVQSTTGSPVGDIDLQVIGNATHDGTLNKTIHSFDIAHLLHYCLFMEN